MYAESPWQGGGAPSAQKRCCTMNGNTVKRVLPESPWQGGGAPSAQKRCCTMNGNTVKRVLLESPSGDEAEGTGSVRSIDESRADSSGSKRDFRDT
jgi:hypothetical protein